MDKLEKKIFHTLMILYLVMFGFKTVVFADGLSCDSWIDLKRDLQNAFDFMKILIPLLIIGLSSYDFIKALTSKEAKNIKKAFTRFGKRFIYAIIFFFLPVILNLLLDIMGTNTKICVE